MDPEKRNFRNLNERESRQPKRDFQKEREKKGEGGIALVELFSQIFARRRRQVKN